MMNPISFNDGPAASAYGYFPNELCLPIGAGKVDKIPWGTEDEVPQRPAAKIPGVNATDVLCGRDKISHSHDGNKNFRKVIESHREDYQNAETRDKKTQITCRIIATVQGKGGRFLKLDEATGLWEEVSDQYAREKVSHALRSAKDPHRPRVKKPRQTKQYVPTDDENTLFQEALAEQQRIFTALVEGHASSQGENDDDDDCNGDEDSDLTSWDFYSG
jgi:hypothetical protein